MVSLHIFGGNPFGNITVVLSVIGMIVSIIFLAIDVFFCAIRGERPLQDSSVKLDILSTAANLAVFLVGWVFVAFALVVFLVIAALTGVFAIMQIATNTRVRDGKVTPFGFWLSTKDYVKEILTRREPKQTTE